jgi:hypothetical protein
MGVYTLNIVADSWRQEEVGRCREGENLILKREPMNRYDANAVAVLRENGEEIGYLSRHDAEWVARIMDDGYEVEARIKWINGGTPDKPSYGVVVDINTRAEEKGSKKGFWRRIF